MAGMDWQVEAGSGKERIGRRGMARSGWAEFGVERQARLGLARHGMARYGLARQAFYF